MVSHESKFRKKENMKESIEVERDKLKGRSKLIFNDRNGT